MVRSLFTHGGRWKKSLALCIHEQEEGHATSHIYKYTFTRMYQTNMMQKVNRCGEWGRRIINQPEAGGKNLRTPAEAQP